MFSDFYKFLNLCLKSNNHKILVGELVMKLLFIITTPIMYKSNVKYISEVVKSDMAN